MADPNGPKIIVDTDWKSQAQAEKERLAAKEEASRPAAGVAGGAVGGAGEEGGEPGLPTASLEELVRMLATQALLYMGAFPDPETGRAVVSLELARLNIDLLGVLEEKTKGNLSESESQVLGRVLSELRMQYVEVSKAVARAIEQGRVSPMGGVGGMGGAGQAPPIGGT